MLDGYGDRTGQQLICHRRTLDDDELDSGDDLEREDRVAPEAPAQEFVTEEKTTMDLEYPRLPGPEPSDGEVCD